MGTATEPLFAVAQELGGAAEQTDRIRAGFVRTATGLRVLLGVVADGRGGSQAGEAAGRVVEQVFQTVERTKARDLISFLRRGLEIAGQSLVKQADAGVVQVAVAAVAIAKNRVFHASAGDAVAIRVSKGRANRLTKSSGGGLGAQPSAEIQSGPPEGLRLERGDRFVLSTEAMLRTSAETGQPFISLSEIAQHVSDLPPSNAARHLASIALGRDVDANVSVLVMAPPGGVRPGRRLRWMAVLGVGAVLLVSTAIGLGWLPRPRTSQVADYGFAVLIEGGVRADRGDGLVQAVGILGTIPASTFVTASTDARLGLQSTFEGDLDLAQGTLYLAQGTEVELAGIDPRRAGNDPGGLESAGLTELRLTRGKLLVFRQDGTREYQVDIEGLGVSLIGSGRGAMGIEAGGGQILMACLLGTCRMSAGGVENALLQAGESIVAVEGTPGEASSIPLEALASWNDLCDGCLAGH